MENIEENQNISLASRLLYHLAGESESIIARALSKQHLDAASADCTPRTPPDFQNQYTPGDFVLFRRDTHHLLPSGHTKSYLSEKG